jgi:hypothetical protein
VNLQNVDASQRCRAAQQDACIDYGTKYISEWYWYELTMCLLAIENICHLLMSMINPLRDVDVESCWRWHHRVMLVMVLSRWHWSWRDVAAKSCWRWHRRVMLVMVLSRWHWPWRDVAAKSCWRWCCRGDLAATQCRCRVMLAMVLLSHAGDGAAEVTWPWPDVDAESCWR